ncbi:hypothetical protein BDA99DRAFT_514559 [Phascolomyces articulosus]|uniref:BSD domain-containing protein n=1 Tax=Phascolomyces articulosus TaxID=60185 RepID=A0AAD5K7H7_9FUNG|nr:hypothetical protein BDA99DRAFT_514559 [Phascolomyces articulosus]
MDDVYQYTNEAVQSNRGTQHAQQQEEEEDVILNAFNNFGFGRRWSTLVDTVKKQSEQVVNVTRNDLQEFAQVLRDDTTQTVEKISKSVKPDVKGKGRAKNVSDFDQGEQEDDDDDDEGIWSYVWHQTQQLPSALRLPDNMDLGKLREEMDQGTRYAEHYLQKFGSEVLDTVNKALDIIDYDEEDGQQQEPEGRPSTSSNRTKRIFATRNERLLAEMRTDADTFLNQVPDTIEFDVEKKTDEIAQTLSEFPDLREMMDRLVPVQVSYVLFWQRYFYHVQKIEKEDEKRQIIAKGADDEGEFKWDSEDEDEPSTSPSTLTQKKEQVDEKKVTDEKKMVDNKQQMGEDQSKKQQEESKKPYQVDNDDSSDSDWE